MQNESETDSERIINAIKAKAKEFKDAGPCSSTLKIIELAKKIRAFEEKFRNDPNALVKPRDPPKGLFS